MDRLELGLLATGHWSFPTSNKLTHEIEAPQHQSQLTVAATSLDFAAPASAQPGTKRKGASISS